jgi:hypothetical protein
MMKILPDDQLRLNRGLELLYKAAGLALHTFTEFRWESLEYEALYESLMQHVLVIRHTESFCAIGKDGLNLLPSAQVIARAAFEISVRALWMLAPADPFAREVRWLSLMEEWERDTKRLEAAGSPPPGFSSAAIGTFRANVGQLLAERNYSKLARHPNFHDMLTELQRRADYNTYMRLSKPVHGTLGATALYRQNLGTKKRLDELITAELWWAEIRVVWHNLDNLTTRLEELTSQLLVDPSALTPYCHPELRTEIQQLLA